MMRFKSVSIRAAAAETSALAAARICTISTHSADSGSVARKTRAKT